MKYQDDKYKPHINKGGGTPIGFKFMMCPKCGKWGVSSRVIGSKIARKVCKYCHWIESKEGNKAP